MSSSPRLAVATSNSLVLLDPLALTHPLTVPCSATPFQLAWSTSRSHLFAASNLGIQRLSVQSLSWKTIIKTRSSEEKVSRFVLKDDGEVVVYAVGNAIHLWNVREAALTRTFECPTNPITSLVLSADGGLLVASSSTSTIVFDLTKNARASLKGCPPGISVASFHPQRPTQLHLATRNSLLTYELSNPRNPPKQIHLEVIDSPIGISHSPFAQNLVAIACISGNVAVVDVDKDSEHIIAEICLENAITSCTFINGKTLICGSDDGRLYEINLKAVTGPLKYTIVDPQGGRVVALSMMMRSFRPTTTSSSSEELKAARLPEGPRRSGKIARPSREVDGVPLREPLAARNTADLVSLKRVSRLRDSVALSKEPAIGANSKPTLNEPYPTQEKVSAPKERPTKPTSPDIRVPRSVHTLASPSPAPRPVFTEPQGRPPMPSPPPDPPRKKAVAQMSLGVAQPTTRPAKSRAASGSQPTASSSQPQQSSPSSRRIVSESYAARADARRAELSAELKAAGMSRISEVADVVRSEPSAKSKRAMEKEPSLDERHLVVASAVSPARRSSPLRHSSDQDAHNPSPIARSSSRSSTRHVPAHILPLETEVQLSPIRKPSSSTTSRQQYRDTPTTDAQEMFRTMVRDVMYEVRQEEREDMIGLHLDIVRAGRTWKNELRKLMGEQMDVLRDLTEENARLRRENDLLRRGL